MRIVYISRSIIPSKTANSINVMKMCSAFASLGHEVILLAPWTKKLETKNINNVFSYYGVEENFVLKKLYSPNIKYLKKRIYSFRCLSQVKKLKPDIVYGRDDMLAFYLIQKSGFLTLFERHEPFYKKDFDYYFFKKFIEYKSKTKLVTISNALKKIYHDEYQIEMNSIHVAHSGTDLIDNTNKNKVMKFESEKINIGYTGSLFKGRGIDIILALAARLPDVNFHIIGGKDKDIEYWKSQSKCNNIKFYGFINPKEIYKYRGMCDILLAPYQESDNGNRNAKWMSPIKIFEYMSSKKAIVCSDLDVIHEVLNSKCAMLVKYNDVNEWEKAIRILIDDKDKRNMLAENSYNEFLNNFTWKNRANSIVDFALSN